VEGLPAWLTPLPDAETMRAIDRWAIEERGIPGLDLMERAGAGVARAVELLAPDGPVTVVCGKGNNGGDGLVVARLLRESGREAHVVCVAPLEEFSGDARTNLERLPGPAPAPLQEAAEALERSAAVVDALLGTGFEGSPHGAVAEAIERIGSCSAPVVSVDVPSGVNASTGAVDGAAVRAAVTVTFHAAKPGLWIRPGKEHAGEVQVLDIGIPHGAPAEVKIGLIEPSVLAVLPRRAPTWTKFDSGHVLVAGGSRGLSGAPRMTAHGSIRAGAGYVTACLPSSQQEIFAAAAPPEVMTRALPEREGAHVSAGVSDVLAAAERGGALALGPGLGRSDGAISFARLLAREVELPLVLDADGLGAHAGRLRDLAAIRKEPTVLTPHAGELARLLRLESAEIERQRLLYTRTAAQQARAVVLLKGDDTLIADAGGRVAVSPGGSPALATAGTGDVLTGVIAALLAQGLEPFTAAAAGVWLHAEAGREAARRQGAPEGVIASDVIAALPAVRAGDERQAGPEERRAAPRSRPRRGARR
jgi:ADP-dependent NAD(P)H-hydrate dehydratase / NAD(P)H-hydrate epimerase